MAKDKDEARERDEDGGKGKDKDKRKRKRRKHARVVPVDLVESALVQVMAEAVDLLGKKKARKTVEWRLAGGDAAEVVLHLLAGGEGTDFAQLVRASRMRVGALAHALLDLQRCGLVEVSAGVARLTPLGGTVAKALEES